MKKALVLFASLLGWLFAWPAWADGVLEPQHHGRMVEAEGYRLEMVTTATGVEVYVTDHDNRQVVVDKAVGKVTLLTASGKVDIPLTPAGNNRLSGAATTTGGEQAAAVIAVDGLAKRLTARLPSGHH